MPKLNIFNLIKSQYAGGLILYMADNLKIRLIIKGRRVEKFILMFILGYCRLLLKGMKYLRLFVETQQCRSMNTSEPWRDSIIDIALQDKG